MTFFLLRQVTLVFFDNLVTSARRLISGVVLVFGV